MVIVAGKDWTDNDNGWAFTGLYIERTRRVLAGILTRSIRGTGSSRRSLRPRSRG